MKPSFTTRQLMGVFTSRVGVFTSQVGVFISTTLREIEREVTDLSALYS